MRGGSSSTRPTGARRWSLGARRDRRHPAHRGPGGGPSQRATDRYDHEDHQLVRPGRAPARARTSGFNRTTTGASDRSRERTGGYQPAPAPGGPLLAGHACSSAHHTPDGRPHTATKAGPSPQPGRAGRRAAASQPGPGPSRPRPAGPAPGPTRPGTSAQRTHPKPPGHRSGTGRAPAQHHPGLRCTPGPAPAQHHPGHRSDTGQAPAQHPGRPEAPPGTGPGSDLSPAVRPRGTCPGPSGPRSSPSGPRGRGCRPASRPPSPRPRSPRRARRWGPRPAW